MTEPDNDLGLTLPLDGVQLIEASAGTGKTFTLATLYARLVIECGLPVSSILAVTYTEAATKELRDRLRKRLVLARRIAEGEGVDERDEAQRLTALLVHAAIAREGAILLQHRLRSATAAMDLAPIYTIHGFCRRALADHALEAGYPLAASELIENETALREEVAIDFWRIASREPDCARTLLSIWKSPNELAKSLRELLSLDVLLPPAGPELDISALELALAQTRVQLVAAFRQHAYEAKQAIDSAIAAGVMHGGHFSKASIEKIWASLSNWVEAGGMGNPADGRVFWLGSQQIRNRTKVKWRGQAPTSPLFEAIEAWHAAVQPVQEAYLARRVAMIHHVGDFARQRLGELKLQRGLIGYDDMIRGVANALAGPTGDAFAERLQAQYRVALLDEFQDTDARQWSIFRRLFGDAASTSDEAPTGRTWHRALFLIGDPKQAIYRFRGGDVFTYLAAANCADQRHKLHRNFRSRPMLLSAVQALFELSGPDAFAQQGIDFSRVEAGERCADDHFRINDAVAPALHVLVLPDSDNEYIDASRKRATVACVASIHALLAAGIAGKAQRSDQQGQVRAIEPGDIAVLVETNKDAARMQQALATAGIPCVAAGRSSLYQTEEAQHLCWLFAALLASDDDERLRAALASPLLGLNASDIAALDVDDIAQRGWQDLLQTWCLRAERHGPMALIGELCAENAARLLALIDGERRLSNYLQLAEELQAAGVHALGLAALLDLLERRILDADEYNDAELLRFESDAARVKILTLHKSKGLEFEFVFLPYVAMGAAQRHATKPDMAKYHDGTQRVALLYPPKDDATLKQEINEERAEDLRLLYVGLTRARLATWLVWGALKDAHKTPLAWLLHRTPGTDTPMAINGEQIKQRLALLQAQASKSAVAIIEAPTQPPATRLRFAPEEPLPPAAIAQRVLSRDWWIYSFSQLTREDTGAELPGADDEIELPSDLAFSRFSGPLFGNSLHTALQQVAMEKWRDWSGELPPPGELELVAHALRSEGYSSENDLLEGIPLLTHLIANTLNVHLPEGNRLADLPIWSRRAEMEFHFSLKSTALAALIDLLHAYGIIAERHSFGLRRRIEGLLTGFIDLVYEYSGRYYLLDYKSNLLRDHAPDTLRTAMRDNEYDLQYVIYTLALHRWLRFRLGKSYDYDAQMGGVRYLFCRGLQRELENSPGIFALTVPRALIESLDELLAVQTMSLAEAEQP